MQLFSLFSCLLVLSLLVVWRTNGARLALCIAAEKRMKAESSGINAVVKGYWVRLNGDNPICFLGWGDTPGKFESRYDGFVGALKLVHINGKITCDRNKPSYKSNWGCYKEDKNLLCIFITDLNKNLLFNRTGGDLGNNVKKYWYGSKIFGPDSEEIVFSRMEDPQFVNSGFQMRIWYGEDLGNIDEINNDGQTCVDVYAHFV